MDFISKIFEFITSLFNKVFSAIKKLLPYILLALAIWLSLGFAFTIPFTTFTIAAGYASALLVAGASFLFAPSETAEIVSKVATHVGDAVGSIVAAGVDVVTTGLGAMLTSPVGLLALGVGLYFLFGRSEKERDAPVAVETQETGSKLLKQESDGAYA